MKIYIYTLKDPETQLVRYVGKSNNPRLRYNNHIQHSKKHRGSRHVVNWICSLLDKNLKPVLEIIEECNENNWAEREIYWIAYHKLHVDLTNYSKGGENSSGLHGEGIGTSKLTLLDVKNIRQLLLKRYNTQYIANRFNVSKLTINDIKLGKTWKELGEFKIEGKLRKITPEQVTKIKELLSKKLSLRKIQSITGNCRPTIIDIKNGKYD